MNEQMKMDKFDRAAIKTVEEVKDPDLQEKTLTVRQMMEWLSAFDPNAEFEIEGSYPGPIPGCPGEFWNSYYWASSLHLSSPDDWAGLDGVRVQLPTITIDLYGFVELLSKKYEFSDRAFGTKENDQ